MATKFWTKFMDDFHFYWCYLPLLFCLLQSNLKSWKKEKTISILRVEQKDWKNTDCLSSKRSLWSLSSPLRLQERRPWDQRKKVGLRMKLEEPLLLFSLSSTLFKNRLSCNLFSWESSLWFPWRASEMVSRRNNNKTISTENEMKKLIISQEIANERITGRTTAKTATICSFTWVFLFSLPYPFFPFAVWDVLCFYSCSFWFCCLFSRDAVEK